MPILKFYLLLSFLFFIQISFSQNVGVGTNNPQKKLHVNGDVRIESLSGVNNRMVITNSNGDLSSQAIPSGDITGVIAGAGLTGGGTSGSTTLAILANNGLNVDATADRIQWGGALTETTTITFGAFSSIFNLNSTGDFLIRDAGVNRFAVLDNGRTTIGGTANAGQFNVTGNSFYSDDIYLRDGSVTGQNLVRIFDSSDDGIIDTYRAGLISNRIHSNGSSFINGGRLGLNTSAPTQQLDVNGEVRIRVLPEGNSTNEIVTTDANGNLKSISNTFGDITAVFTGDGLGGGASSGSATIHALVNTGIRINQNNEMVLGGNIKEPVLLTQGEDPIQINLNGTGDFQILDNNTPLLSAFDNGRISIGSTDTWGIFNVQGSSVFGGSIWFRDQINSNSNYMRIYRSGDAGVIGINNQGNTRILLHANDESWFNGGNVAIGNVQPDYSLEVFDKGLTYAAYFNGNVYTTGSYLPSHSSLKNNIRKVKASLSKLMKVEVVSYNYNKHATLSLPAGVQTGVIAEQLKELYPELVKEVIHSGLKEGDETIEYEAVNYTGLIPHMINSIQEQQTLIEQQNEKIERLETLVEQLLQKEK